MIFSIFFQPIKVRSPPRLFFLARKSQQKANSNCHFFRDVLFSSRIQCIQWPLPPFLAKNERPRDGPTSLKLLSFYFWLWASLVPSSLSFHSFPGPREAGGAAVAAVVCVVSQFLSSQLMSCRSSHATFVVPVNSPHSPARARRAAAAGHTNFGPKL